MKKLLIVLGIAFLSQNALASAKTDWTPYLEPMLSGCESLNPVDDLPARYESSIVSKTEFADASESDISEYEGDIVTTFELNNAMAFGQPLSKLEYLRGYEWSHLKLYFTEDTFMALRPRFKLPMSESDEQMDEFITVMKNDTNGYAVDNGVGYTTLEFNRTEKSITCDSGL